MTDIPAYFRYWGKAKPQQEDGGSGAYHLLAFHSMDVAAVGWHLLSPENVLCQRLAKQLKVESDWLQQWFVFCLCLHDLGKFTRSFQNLAPDLSNNLVAYFPQCVYDIRHDSLGYGLWQKILLPKLKDKFQPESVKQISEWLEIVFGHHGQPPNKGRATQNIRSYLLQEDEQAAEAFFSEIINHRMPEPEPLLHIQRDDFRQVSWQLAGIAVLADWLGSNQDVFPYHVEPMPLEKYWQKISLPAAKDVLKLADISAHGIAPFQDICQQFDFIKQPTPLQHYAQTLNISDSPQLFLLEDVTGAGKTEAAMVLVHRLMAKGLATGVYVGLPTMATANAMYERMSKSYRSLYHCDFSPSLVLAHGASRLSEAFQGSVQLTEQPKDKAYQKDDETASAYCNQWLADNRKKALLADVGIGTIDQALLSVVPARHQSLRLLGLTGKVLVVDEVHAFDPYMRQLLAHLLQAHAAQGGSAILLSATLPYRMRCELTDAYAKGLGVESAKPQQQNAYPLLTQFNALAINETAIETRDEVRRQVLVKRLADESAVLEQIHDAVQQGYCVCWIRNTVKDARYAYEQLAEQDWVSSDKLSLFHSRFAMIDRQQIEQDVLKRFGKKSHSQHRKGQILIATQVVEQSLDLDFDVMFSDLAPMDLLIQRAGRLQRHIRDKQGNPAKNHSEQRDLPCLYVLSPDPATVSDDNWLKALLSGTQAVYPNVGQLWLTITTLQINNGFLMPEDARFLIESVYGEDTEQIPGVLETATFEAEAEQKAQSGMGEFNRLKLEKGYTWLSAGQNGGWDEDVHIPTRLGGDTVTVALAIAENDTLRPYANNTRHAWALSQINLPVREWAQAQKLIPPEWQEQIRLLRDKEPALKWIDVFPLVETTTHIYHAAGGWNLQRNKNNESD